MDFRLNPYQLTQIDLVNTTPWNIQKTNAPIFRAFAKNISPVVAVIDTGIDLNHQEFAGRIYKPRTFDGTPMSDSVGHGTHVAGTIAGKTVGMFPNARIMPLKVNFGSNQTHIQIWDAFLAIMDHNKECADEDKVVVVNCSFSGPPDAFINYYIRTLVSSGVTVVVAAGNNGDGNPNTEEPFSYPGFIYEVITTGALDQQNTPTGFSSSYDGIDISAPGADVISAIPGGGFGAMSGTSMAAPHVAGAVLLLKAAFRYKHKRWPTTEETEEILWECVKPLSFDEKLIGRGMLFLPHVISSQEKRVFLVPPKIDGGRTTLPVRDVGELFDFNVDWDANLRMVTIEKLKKRATMFIDKIEYLVEKSLL